MSRKSKKKIQKNWKTVLGTTLLTKAEKAQQKRMKALALDSVNQRIITNKKDWLKKPSSISFPVLRRVAATDAIIRICINVIKKTVSQSKWQIQVKSRFKKEKNAEKTYAAEIEEAYELFENMNENDENMRMLLDRIIEDLLTLDAWAIEIIRSKDGKKIMGLNSVDSSTIRPVVNDYWNAPWQTAYKQFVWDKEVASFSRDELIYLMANPQNSLAGYGYGLSPIESIMMQVQASMEAEMYNMKTFSSNNVPAGLLDLGDVSEEEAEWVMATWNATVVWNTEAMKFMWGSGADRKYTPFQKSNKDMQFSQYIEWLSRIKLATYWLTAQDANIDVDLNRSTAEVHASMSNARWVKSMKRLIEEYFTRGIIRKMWDEEWFKKIEFAFIDVDTLADKLIQAEIDELNVVNWVYAPKFIQERDWYPVEKITPPAQVIAESNANQNITPVKKPKKDKKPKVDNNKTTPTLNDD